MMSMSVSQVGSLMLASRELVVTIVRKPGSAAWTMAARLGTSDQAQVIGGSSQV